MSKVKDLQTALNLCRAKSLCYRRLLAKLGYLLPFEAKTVEKINEYAKEHNLLTTSLEDKFLNIPQTFKTKSQKELLKTCCNEINPQKKKSCFGLKGPDDGTRCLFVYVCNKTKERKKNKGCSKWKHNPH